MCDTANSVIHVAGLTKAFTTERGEQLTAVDGIDLDVSANEFVCIVGPSGCGKSTALRIIAGLEKATSGTVQYRGDPVTKPGKEVGMVFQEYSLFPWLSVLDNIAAGLEFAGISKAERREKAKEYLDIVGMPDFADAYPHELSGGMRQRVAIARALANDPDVLLMDEPFGALDAHTRILLQRELLRIWEVTQKTILFVTHSVDEAVYLADRIVIMSHHPGTIRDVLTVDMPRPRSRAMPEFGKLTDSILSALE
ncbi:ABC transporter ATP-binding protein [Halodesulfovibrio sp.]|jgi:NitT/TauT family transport system ATP-binding protein|uniref:ABC transporter ATP-binding protein n=1 Tax=Halodesulfovibrio sp. TaxID=1912772 RepID=UPI0025DA35E2|nr:ABC transporter ATP-binding protein [Halodesulfovibrio sp.]MCT4534683.1 ABC transporter ATP-binding protein [Halodesulfovibrio sp.]